MPATNAIGGTTSGSEQTTSTTRPQPGRAEPQRDHRGHHQQQDDGDGGGGQFQGEQQAGDEAVGAEDLRCSVEGDALARHVDREDHGRGQRHQEVQPGDGRDTAPAAADGVFRRAIARSVAAGAGTRP